MSGERSGQQLPLYQQVRELLHREIAAGRWQAGERLPTEAALAGTLGVAVGTLRKSLAALEADGLVERRQGSGTYLRAEPLGAPVYRFLRLERRDGQSGLPGAQVLALQRQRRQRVSDQLALPADTALWRIRRLRSLGQLAVAVEEIWLPQARAPALLREQLHESLYLHYREHCGFWVSQVEDRVGAVGAPDWVAQALECAPGLALGVVERLARDQHDAPVEVSITWFDPDRARYSARWR